ncbi:bifunctional nuclease family protein, partial [Brevibacterium sp. UMB1308A]
GWEPPRPLSHNLLVDIIEAFGTELDRVVITHRDGHIIYSELHLSDGKVISARPSDAVAMALISQCTIETTQELLDDIGIDAPQADEEEVAQFREFLDHVSPEDFD